MEENGKHRPPMAIEGGRPTALVPQTFEDAYRIATAIARAGMASQAFRADPTNKSSEIDPNKVLIAILSGAEVGLTPIAAVQSIVPINGVPCLWGDGLLGVVRSSRLLSDFQEWKEGSGDSLTAYCKVRREDTGEEQVRSFSIQDAKAAGLYNKAGPWQGYKPRMCQMRARAWALRDTFADVLRGLRSADEMMDVQRLEEQPDGTYAITDAPPRPTVEDFREAEDQTGAIRMFNADGSHRWQYDDPIAFVCDLSKYVHQSPAEKDAILAANAASIEAALQRDHGNAGAVQAIRDWTPEKAPEAYETAENYSPDYSGDGGEAPDSADPDGTEDDGDRVAWDLYANNLIGEIKGAEPKDLDDILADNSEDLAALREAHADLADKIDEAVEAKRPRPAPAQNSGIRRPPKKNGGQKSSEDRELFP